VSTEAQAGARWLPAAFERAGYPVRTDAVAGIRARFGAGFVPEGRIRRDVLHAFARLAPAGRVWSMREQAWRRATDSFARGRGWREGAHLAGRSGHPVATGPGRAPGGVMRQHPVASRRP
jgi:hypothetical protein